MVSESVRSVVVWLSRRGRRFEIFFIHVGVVRLPLQASRPRDYVDEDDDGDGDDDDEGSFPPLDDADDDDSVDSINTAGATAT